MDRAATNEEHYVVVRSEAGRTSCWPVDAEIPRGWTASSTIGTKEHCLSEIERCVTAESPAESPNNDRLKMSLMFFGDSEDDTTGNKYRLLLESAEFADENGFEAIWLPERHFTRFGCLYPDPAVLHAALAMQTKRLRLRAGSVVLPLNEPIRVAEQWSVVDNLSNGRVELAFASGWHPDDFALMPDAYDDRYQRMLRGIEDVQQLWHGESIQRQNGAGDSIRLRSYPSPSQTALPIWLTAAGNPETFRRAGELGFDVLTHLFHQDVTELHEKIAVYRKARRHAGHHDPHGRVAVTLHAFVGNTIGEVKQKAGEPYCEYIKSNLSLLKQLAFSQKQSVDLESLPSEELDHMIRWLLDKFIGGRSLMGTVASCAKTCQELAEIGVSEIACLLDFGPNTDDVLAHLPQLAKLNEQIGTISVNRS